MKATVAVLDDEQRMVDILCMLLRREGYEALGFSTPAEALAALADNPFDLLLVDLKMPQMDGIEVLKRARALDPDLPVILMTAFATVQTAIAAMREGAFDYLQKPFDNQVVKNVARRALDMTRLSRENRYLRAELKSRYHLDRIVAESEAMRHVLDIVRRVARTPSTVLILGESGTGKELIARALHYHSDRVGAPFVAVNARAFSEGVLESELFGHEKGAFTGAAGARPGLFERADGGTLFLDEIGEVTLNFQTKLLRVLQEREVQRVGGQQPRAVDVRVVTATNRDLKAEVAAGRFREDLFYRLAVIPIRLPPLRERPEAVLPLARHFLERVGARLNRQPPDLSPEVEAWFKAHTWPGNVRELENTVERGVVLCPGDQIEIDHLLLDPADHHAVAQAGEPTPGGGTLQEALDRATVQSIEAALRAAEGGRNEAARALGIDRTTLYRLMKRHGIEGE